MIEALNSPIAVVGILAGMAVFIREASWFVKTARGTGHDAGQKELIRTLREIQSNLSLMNEKLRRVEITADASNNLLHEMKGRI